MKHNEANRAKHDVSPAEAVALERSLSLLEVALYGLGTILGAGIYVLIGAVTAEAGAYMPLSFVVAATVAAFTALSYGELAARLPVSAGEAAYVDAAFGRRLITLAVGLGVVAVGVISAAVIANGFAAYLAVFLPGARGATITVLLLALTLLAVKGIRTSVWAANAVTVVGIVGLLLVIGVAGEDLWSMEALSHLVPPLRGEVVYGIAAGALLAFYAFIGFEDMVNLAEEVRDPAHNLPRAIIIALVVSTSLYVLVALTAITSVPVTDLAAADAPLARVFEVRGHDPGLIALISLVAVVNGALVQIIMASRVLFGLARDGRLPRGLAGVSPTTRTPILATVLAGAMALVLALTFPLEELAALTSTVTLLVFTGVNAALIQLKRNEPPSDAIRVPLWVPVTGCVTSLSLMTLQIF